MGLLDILIIMVILAFGIMGFQRGITKQIVMFIGTLIVLFLAYKFKFIIGDFLVLHCPFINFSWSIQSLNIIFYQGIAFLLLLLILGILLKVLIEVTSFIEKVLKYTIILGIPSKILGMILGFVEGYIIAFVIIFVVSQPFYDSFLGFKRTKFSNSILNSSPILSSITSDAVDLINDVYHLKDKDNKNDVELRVVDLCLEKEVTSVSIIDSLVEDKKLEIEGIETILAKYRK